MAILTSENQLGGLVGDTFGNLVLDRVISDGNYVWENQTVADNLGNHNATQILDMDGYAVLKGTMNLIQHNGNWTLSEEFIDCVIESGGATTTATVNSLTNGFAGTSYVEHTGTGTMTFQDGTATVSGDLVLSTGDWALVVYSTATSARVFKLTGTAATSLHIASISAADNAWIDTVETAVGPSSYRVPLLTDTDHLPFYDPNSMIDTANNYIEIKQSGRYMITASATKYNNADAGIRVNGVFVSGDTNQVSTTEQAYRSYVGDLVVGDKVEWDSGGIPVTSAFSNFSMIVQQLPEGLYVDPDMVVPETLHVAQFGKNGNANFATTGGFIQFDNATFMHDPNSLISATDNTKLIIKQAGKYKLTWSSWENSQSTPAPYIDIDGVTIRASVSSGTGEHQHVITWIGDLAVDAEIRAGQGSGFLTPEFTLQQLPTHTVIRAETKAFSTTEQITDLTWIDGKPIYETVVSMTSGVSNGMTLATDVDRLVDAHGSWRTNSNLFASGDKDTPFPWGDSSYRVMPYVNSLDRIVLFASGVGVDELHAVLRYTKV